MGSKTDLTKCFST